MQAIAKKPTKRKERKGCRAIGPQKSQNKKIFKKRGRGSLFEQLGIRGAESGSQGGWFLLEEKSQLKKKERNHKTP